MLLTFCYSTEALGLVRALASSEVNNVPAKTVCRVSVCFWANLLKSRFFQATAY